MQPPDNTASARYMSTARHRPGFWCSTARTVGASRGVGMTGTVRSSAGLDERRRRLLYRSWHRGTREMDLIMGRFADAAVSDLTEAEITELERLSEQPEPDIYAWITNERPVPAAHDTPVFHRLRGFAR